jgi:hypothetical protein
MGRFSARSRVALPLAAGPAVPAIACFARLFGTGLRIRSLLLFRRVTCVPDDEGKYTDNAKIPAEKSQEWF